MEGLILKDDRPIIKFSGIKGVNVREIGEIFASVVESYPNSKKE